MSPQRRPNRPLGQQLVVLATGIIALLYLLNPTAGFDLLPDMLPIVGNLDEVGAVMVLLSALRYYGLDLVKFIDLAKDRDNVIEGDYVEREPPEE